MEQEGQLTTYYAKAKKYGVGKKGARAVLYYYLMYTPSSHEKAVERALNVLKESTAIDREG
jgi:hypothetical protein